MQRAAGFAAPSGGEGSCFPLPNRMVGLSQTQVRRADIRSRRQHFLQVSSTTWRQQAAWTQRKALGTWNSGSRACRVGQEGDTQHLRYPCSLLARSQAALYMWVHQPTYLGSHPLRYSTSSSRQQRLPGHSPARGSVPAQLAWESNSLLPHQGPILVYLT